jgi:NAD(P)H-flavin reductase
VSTAARSAAAPRIIAPFGRRLAAVITREQHGAYTVLRCADPEGPEPAAGQFYMLSAAKLWGGGEGERPYLPRAFSVLRTLPVREGVELQFLLEDVGPGTHRLCQLGAGDHLQLVGPLGVGFAPAEPGYVPVLVGGGVGIAPLAIWQDKLLAAGSAEPRVLLGFRDLPRAQGAALLRPAQVATDDGSAGHHGLVTELLLRTLEELPRVEVYACGPPPMLEAVRALCAAHGVRAQLALESGMACGYGACFGCVMPTHRGLIRLCLEGPVLDAGLLPSAIVPGAGH